MERNVETCAACGGRLTADLDWCPRCYVPGESARAPQTHASGRPGFPLPFIWRPEDPGPPPVYSRWRGGTTTFGPIGRIVLTLGTAAAGAACWELFGPPPPFGLGLASSGWLAFVLLAPPILRSAWRKDRVE